MCSRTHHYYLVCLRTLQIIWCVHEHTKYKRCVRVPYVLWVNINEIIFASMAKRVYNADQYLLIFKERSSSINDSCAIRARYNQMLAAILMNIFPPHAPIYTPRFRNQRIDVN